MKFYALHGAACWILKYQTSIILQETGLQATTVCKNLALMQLGYQQQAEHKKTKLGGHGHVIKVGEVHLAKPNMIVDVSGKPYGVLELTRQLKTALLKSNAR